MVLHFLLFILNFNSELLIDQKCKVPTGQQDVRKFLATNI
jgi:hypothetical protein